MRKREKILPPTETQISLLAQFIVIYGIMSGIVLISFIGLHAEVADSTRSDFENVFVNSFMPTTITIFATALFEYDFVKEDKRISAIFIILTITMSLFYVGFVYLEILQKTSVLTTIMAITGISITAISFFYLFLKIIKLNRIKRAKYAFDGNICATRRVL